MATFSFENFAQMADQNTDQRLIPELLQQTTNTDEISYCMLVLKEAMRHRLDEEEQSLLKEFYWENHTKRSMARKRGVVHSTIVKRMQTVEDRLRDYLEFSLIIYRKQKNEDNFL